MPTNDDFKRLLDNRMGKLQHFIKMIGNLSRYPHDQSEAVELIGTIQRGLDDLRQKFKVPEPDQLVRPATNEPVVDTKGPVRIIEKNPNGGVRSVEGIDRRDIREALRTIQAGDVEGGVKSLQHVVLGWPVPDRLPESETATD